MYDIECGRFSEISPVPWQADDRLEDQITWSIVQEPKYKSASRIIHQLCDIVSKNGNLLLNVGPREDGSFPQEAVDILHQVGDWLTVNGEAIYGTRPFHVFGEGPTLVKKEDYDIQRIEAQTKQGLATDTTQHQFTCEDIRFTAKENVVYAISFGKPNGNIQKIQTLGKRFDPLPIESISLLGDYEILNYIQNEDSLDIFLPPHVAPSHAYCYRIVLK